MTESGTITINWLMPTVEDIARIREARDAERAKMIRRLRDLDASRTATRLGADARAVRTR